MITKRVIILSILLMALSVPAYARPQVLLITVDGGITPSSAEYIENNIDYAREKNFSALVIELNTPGGLLESTRKIIQKMLASPVPVIVYVAPSGSRAGSAGVFITLAANIAAMAPGTNIGAAHPVGMQGEADSSVMFHKITNDAAAFIRSIAQNRGRNADWAERAVRESISATEAEALKEGVINLISPSLDSLLIKINGIEVHTSSGRTYLSTANANVVHREPDWREKLLALLTDPNIAYIFMMIGIYGILFELYNPGSIFPGVAGGICIIIAAYSLQMLPVNYAGLALIILAVILFVLEIKIVSHGLLTIGGVISLLLGSIMLIDSPFEFLNISLSIIITSVVLTTLFFTIVLGLGIKAQSKKKVSGADALIGEIGVMMDDLKPSEIARVRVHGEIWNAVSDAEIASGSRIVVESVSGLTLRVSPFEEKQ